MTDHDLAKRAQRGDPDAFVELAHRYQHQLYRVAYRFAGTPDRAEDLCQDCLLRAYCQLGRYDAKRPFLPWLMRVAWNVCLNDRKSDIRRREMEYQLPDECLAISDDDIEDAVFAKLERQRVLAALGTLPEDIRLLVIMRFVLGLSFREIAEQTGVKLPTVAFRVSKGIDILRRSLKDGSRVNEP